VEDSAKRQWTLRKDNRRQFSVRLLRDVEQDSAVFFNFTLKWELTDRVVAKSVNSVLDVVCVCVIYIYIYIYIYICREREGVAARESSVL